MFAETIPVDVVFLSYLYISFKNTQLQFILALEEMMFCFSSPALRKKFPAMTCKYCFVRSFAVPYCKIWEEFKVWIILE